MAFFTLIVGLTGFARLTAIGNSAVKTIHNVTILNYIYDYNAAIDSGVYSMVFVKDITLSQLVVQTTMEHMEKLLKHLNEYLKFQEQFSDVFTLGEMQNMANLLEIYEETYIPVLYEIFNLVEQNRHEEALLIYVNRFSPIYDTFIYYLNMGFNKNLQNSEIKTAKNNESASLSANLMLAVVLISLIVSVMFALAVTKSIANPLSEVESAAGKIANGEITEQSYYSTFNDFNSNDEITSLSQRLKEMLLQMAQVQRLKLDAAEAKNEKEKAEALARSKGDFLARMSHEIRTPMNAITGMAELALRDDLPETAREHIITIKQASVNLLSIINDILDFSKIESGKLEIVPAEYLFSSLINDVINIIRTRVIDSNIQFTANIDCNIPNVLFGDEIRVHQIFLNILSNAVKYTKEGFVSFNVTGVTHEDIVNLTIKVEDSGNGIKQEDIEKLFGDFIQINLISNRGIEGTGLGLAITRSLVKAMNGEISVDSEYGKGSTFTVTLPQRISRHEKLSFVENPKDKSVLLYEHRQIYALSILHTLEDLGVNCKLVTSEPLFSEETKNQTWAFVFVSSDLFENAVKILSQNKSNSKIIALAAFGEVFANKDLSVLTMPAHSISVANILNGVTTDSTSGKNKKIEVRFTAPGARVLVVDDINTNLKVAEGLLQPYKMQIDLCNNGQGAIEAIKHKPYDLVFMDHMMPEMDGVETVALIRAWEKEQQEKNAQLPESEIHIIALTANAVLGMREMFMEKGFNDFLTKPIDVFKLDEILIRWIPEEKKEQGISSGEQLISSNEQNQDLIIPGVDMAKGITMTGGTRTGYLNVLSMFCKDAQERLSLLQTVPEAGDYGLQLFTTHVHAMKSACAAIGAAHISALAAELETAGRNGDTEFIEKRLSAFAEQMTELVKNIRTALEADTAHNAVQPHESPESASSVLIPLLRELDKALKTQKTEAIDRITNQLTQQPLESGVKTALEQISDEVLIAEYGNAGKILEGLFTQITKE
jgi:signal transduction histidine kinase/CheY-like chemotaxis protein